MDTSVAMPTPSTCWPSGRIQYMNTGSSTMLSTAPSVTPKPASREWPMLRTRLDMTLESTVGTAPSTMIWLTAAGTIILRSAWGTGMVANSSFLSMVCAASLPLWHPPRGRQKSAGAILL